MPNTIHSGSNGAVYIGDVAIASIRSFSLEETQETIDATTMNTSGVAFRTNKPTFKSWNGTVDVFWTVDSDSAGVANSVEAGASLTPGSTEVTLHFWPDGDDQRNVGYFGNALVTSRTISSSVDGMIEASVSVIGTSAIAIENGS